MGVTNYNILSLDQSTRGCGWCIYKGGEYHSSGVLVPVNTGYEKRMFEVYNFISTKIREHNITLGTVEGIWLNERTETTGTGNYFKSSKSFGDNLNTYKVLGELMGACKMSMIGVGTKRVMELSPSKWKSFFSMLGKGIDRDKQKSLAIIYAKKISGKENINDDEADAICQCKFASKEFFNMSEKLKDNEFKIEGFPYIFREFEKKDYNDLSKRLDIKIEREEKIKVGTTPNGKNKWEKVIVEKYVEELGSMTLPYKIQFLEKMKLKGFKSELAEKVFEEQYKRVCNNTK